MTSNYNITEHVHRFAAWCASTAARASTTNRFSVKLGTEIIQRCDVFKMEGNHENLPDPEKFDELHRVWRLQVVEASGAARFTHGVAAKLINCYLKAAMVNRHTVSNPKVKAIHPPIDRILLTNLKKYRRVKFLGIPLSGGVPAWSTLNSDQYEKLIQCLREFIAEDGNGSDRGLWELERYWWIT